ncbi:hypothetical protein [Clostridium folliculivorans]|uniref:Uncharacterized protein n=1 Tax=Clostridium folliculivorans TaxID=2886038 RepID=A0A9W5Y2R4_9CLOT|nr:hypothetical protein [Clostridium folliculivorans]GKU25475.1 hypothetical protein CFOLD11_23010 [Clostridium folliculivorans]GKU28497.1 hypothetical protein CFB3_06030 [Clostridium folliculivorans]
MDLKDNQQNYTCNPYVINAGDTPSIQEGPLSKRPLPKIKGRLFLDTDHNILQGYRM